MDRGLVWNALIDNLLSSHCGVPKPTDPRSRCLCNGLVGRVCCHKITRFAAAVILVNKQNQPTKHYVEIISFQKSSDGGDKDQVTHF